jgi:hypothetical protein
VLSRYSINGSLISQVKCAPSSPFSVSLHPSGVLVLLIANIFIIENPISFVQNKSIGLCN